MKKIPAVKTACQHDRIAPIRYHQIEECKQGRWSDIVSTQTVLPCLFAGKTFGFKDLILISPAEVFQ